jgi:hypothetical protein
VVAMKGGCVRGHEPVAGWAMGGRRGIGWGGRLGRMSCYVQRPRAARGGPVAQRAPYGEVLLDGAQVAFDTSDRSLRPSAADVGGIKNGRPAACDA